MLEDKHSPIQVTVSNTALLDTTLALGFEVLVEGLPSTALLLLYLAVLLLEAPTLLLASKDFFHKSTLAVLVLDPARQVLGGSFDDGTNLAVLRCLHFAAIFLVVTVRVKDISHLQKLQVSLELWC